MNALKLWAGRIGRGLLEPSRYRQRSRILTSEVAYWLGTGHCPPPQGIYLNVNNVCNLKCRMCDVGTGDGGSSFYDHMLEHGKDDPMSLEEWKGFLDRVAPFKPLIYLTSTEPLLYKGVAELVAHASSRGLFTQITTNAFLLERHAEPLVAAGLQRLNVSLDGNAEVHDRIRGVLGSFRRAADGIRALREAAKARGVKAPFVHLNATICDLNYDRLPETLQALLPLDPDSLAFSHLGYISPETARRHSELFPQYAMQQSCDSESGRMAIDIGRLAEGMARVRAEAPRDLNLFFFPEIPADRLEDYYRKPGLFLEGRRCHQAWADAQVLSNGDVVPQIRCVSEVYGNVRRTPFLEVWNGDRARAFRRLLREGTPFPICSRCCSIFKST